MKIKLTKDKKVYNFCEPYVIAEIGANHNGDMALAKALIDAAKDSGADCVKFQSWSKDTLFSRKKYEESANMNLGSEHTLEQIVEKYSISEEELLNMKSYADSLGIDCTSTPFSKKEADFLVDKLDAPFIKVASMDLNNYPFLEYLAKKNKPMVVSTGLSELYEIDKAIKTIESAGNKQIVILHCVASYPPNDADVHLNSIKTLSSIYPNYPIGFSDHTLGPAITLASVALGACVIEKHFTLDKNMDGWDHGISADKKDMKLIVEGSKKIARSLGTTAVFSTESTEQRNQFRRSLVLTKNMKKGEVINIEDVDFKRPGTGIPPEDVKHIVNRRLKIDKDKDDQVLWSDIE